MKILKYVLCTILLYGALRTANADLALPIRIEESEEGTKVFLDRDLIVNFSKNHQFLNFRASGENTMWVGETRAPMNLCWAYRDKGVSDFECTGYSSSKSADSFEVRVFGSKPSIDGTVETVLKAGWLPEKRGFEYTLSSRLKGSLEDYYRNSRTANLSGRPSRIEPLDWCIEHITDRRWAGTPRYSGMYDWFVYSTNRTDWAKAPKAHILYPARQGTRNYPTIFLCTLVPGGVLGWMDDKNGGWLAYLESENPKQLHEFEICWMAFDIHCLQKDAIPARGTQEKLDIPFSMRFVPQLPSEAGEIIGKAKEVEWRSLKEYHLPVFDYSKVSDFRELISCKDGQYMWLASSLDCDRDDTVGYDDHYSVTIKKDDDPPAAWHAFSWGPWYVPNCYKGSYRVRAMVKTEGCKGRVGLAVVRNFEPEWGVYKYPGWDKGSPDLKWERSRQLSGDNDWTEITLDVIVADGEKTPRTIVLEQEGAGQSWFDNVAIEKLHE